MIHNRGRKHNRGIGNRADRAVKNESVQDELNVRFESRHRQNQRAKRWGNIPIEEKKNTKKNYTVLTNLFSALNSVNSNKGEGEGTAATTKICDG
jgi:hypothetical protein